MALKEGEHYRCTDPECRCEIEVTRGAQPGGGEMRTRASPAAGEMKKVS